MPENGQKTKITTKKIQGNQVKKSSEPLAPTQFLLTNLNPDFAIEVEVQEVDGSDWY